MRPGVYRQGDRVIPVYPPNFVAGSIITWTNQDLHVLPVVFHDFPEKLFSLVRYKVTQSIEICIVVVLLYDEVPYFSCK